MDGIVSTVHQANDILPRRAAVSTSGGVRTVPPDVLLSGVRRLRVLAMVMLGIYLLFAVISVMLPALGVPVLPWVHPGDADTFARECRWHEGTGIFLSVAMLAITRWKRLTPRRIIDIGSAFQVVGALLFSMCDYLVPWATGSAGVPTAALWLMAFPLVPSTLRRSAVVAFAAAAMGPASMAIAGALGRTVPAPAAASAFYVPLFVGALVVTLVSGVVYRLSVDMSRAQKLGAYTLVKKIAQGGMGEVWEARHGSLIRPAAVKLIRPETLGHKSTEEMTAVLRRFVREAQSTASLSSPHTVALYDFGRTDGGTVYYVMELLGGMDLENLVRRFGPLPAARVVHILGQALESLAEAHRHGLVHRDIKPANLQLAVVGGRYDFVKVLDFGLVKHVGGSGPLVTADEVITGTPAYMAPEGASSRGAVDERSDLYSLGCVAYWLLTGRLVFEAHTPVAMILAHVGDAPVPPSRRSELAIPPELEDLVLDLIAKDPARRPASADEVIRRLAAVPLDVPWTQDRAERWWRAHLPDEVRRTEHESCPTDGTREPVGHLDLAAA